MQKKILLVWLAAVAVGLAAASAAWACTSYVGQTYVNDSAMNVPNVSKNTPFKISADDVPRGPIAGGGLGHPAEGTTWMPVAAEQGACCSNAKYWWNKENGNEDKLLKLERIDGTGSATRDFVNKSGERHSWISIPKVGKYSMCLLFTTQQDDIDKLLNTSIPRPDKNQLGSSGNWATGPANLEIVN